MKIGLIDVDGRVRKGKAFPNLALMKISAWHKQRGDEVEMCFPLKRYDKVYASKIFTFTPDIDFTPMCDEFVMGGTGYSLESRLPDDIEHTFPDYSLYGITDTAYGFMSRGCPRGCQFCIVASKEGRVSRKVADLREFWDGQKNIELFDPNTLACREWRDILGQLADSRAWVNINQGADIRMLTDEKVEALMRVKLRTLHFAWDNPKDDLAPMFKRFADYLHKFMRDRDLAVYVLTNYNSTLNEDLHRIYTLRDLGFTPYVMVYDKKNAPREVKMLQRWCNMRAIFRSVPRFEEYKKRNLTRTPRVDTITNGGSNNELPQLPTSER